MSSEVINVGKLMREEVRLVKLKRDKRFKVSKNAVQEEISFLRALIEKHIQSICGSIIEENKRRKNKNNIRSTILEVDVIYEHGFKRADSVED